MTQTSRRHQAPTVYMTPQTIRALMQQHHVTIRTLATRMQIPQTLVRQRRREGITCPGIARDWLEWLTGIDPGPVEIPIE